MNDDDDIPEMPGPKQDGPHYNPSRGVNYAVWKNVLLSGEEGYTKPMAVLLTQGDLHNIIVTVLDLANKSDVGEHTRILWLDLAERLEVVWRQSFIGENNL